MNEECLLNTREEFHAWRKFVASGWGDSDPTMEEFLGEEEYQKRIAEYAICVADDSYQLTADWYVERCRRCENCPPKKEEEGGRLK